MAKNAVGDWSATAANNTDISGVNIDEGCAPSALNNMGRAIMAQIATFKTAAYFGSATNQQALVGGGTITPALQVRGTTSNNSGLLLATFSATASTGPRLDFYRSKDATIDTATVVASGDRLGTIAFFGAQQTGTLANQVAGVSIRAEVDGTVTSGASGDMPGRLIIATTPDGSGAATDRLTIDNAGKATFTGVIDISGAAAGQIVFPASQNSAGASNTFDDYEEGTFVPRIDGTTLAGAGTYTTQASIYTKIGNCVCFSLNIVWTAHTGTGNMIVPNLPFTANGNANYPLALAPSNLTAANPLYAYVAASTTQIVIGTAASAGAFTALGLDGAASFYASGNYQA